MPSQSSGKKKQKRKLSESAKSSESASSDSDSPSQRRSAPGPVMGLDLSLTGCGVVVMKKRKGKVVVALRLQTSPATKEGSRRGQLAPDQFVGSLEERIAWLAKKIVKVARKNQVCLVIIEDHAFSARGRGKTSLCELHGVVKHYLMLEEIAFDLKTPQTIKKHVTGNGRADKTDMIFAAKAAGMEFRDSDRADAWGCADYAYNYYDDLVD